MDCVSFVACIIVVYIAMNNSKDTHIIYNMQGFGLEMIGDWQEMRRPTPDDSKKGGCFAVEDGRGAGQQGCGNGICRKQSSRFLGKQRMISKKNKKKNVKCTHNKNNYYICSV